MTWSNYRLALGLLLAQRLAGVTCTSVPIPAEMSSSSSLGVLGVAEAGSAQIEAQGAA